MSSSPELGTPPFVVGRKSEIERIRRVLEAAAAGYGAGLVVRGEPGMGKTTVLRAGANAPPAPMRVIHARGVEAEAEIGYATLADVLRPAAPRLDALVPAQQAALESALSLGPPSPADPLMIGSAALSLLAAHAESAPVAVFVDDLQFVDAASQLVLAFIARRLESESIALVVAVRANVRSPLDGAGVDELLLEPLDDDSAATIVTQTVPNVVGAVRDRIVGTARGNPLALVELPTLLDDAQLQGRRPLDDPLRVNGSVNDAFAHRLARLSDDARRALLVVSADDTADLHVVRSAVAALRIPADALEEAELEGALELGPPLRVRHPLLRSLAYHQARPADQRAVHAALAESVGNDSYRAAWHRGLAASDPDEKLAAELDEAAAGARARGRFASAAAASDRAAALSTDTDARARRLVFSATSHLLAGSVTEASARTMQALELASAPDVRAEAVLLQANALLFGGQPREAFALLVREAAETELSHPDAASMLLAQAVMACQVTSEIDLGIETGHRAVDVAARAGPRARLGADLALAEVLILRGEVSSVRDLHARARSVAPLDDPLVAGQLLQSEGAYLMIVGEHEQARRVIGQIVAGARSAGMPTVLPYPLVVLAELEFRTGRWSDAVARASEAVEIAEQAGQGLFEAHGLQMLARVEAAIGDVTAARAHLDRAEALGGRLRIEAAQFFNAGVRMFVELTEGRFEAAVTAGGTVEKLSLERGVREHGVVLWAADLVEAYVRTGRMDDAVELLERFEEDGRRTERTWALAAAARCRGLIEDDFEGRFEMSLALHERAGMPFETARTQLLLGKRRRRAGRRSAARDVLASALGTFERLGAGPWAERARSELRAAGTRSRTSESPPTDDLTPHEVRVALIIARGATTREAAAELLVSPKTVDYHLQRIYRKLGISSRAQLARLFPDQ